VSIIMLLGGICAMVVWYASQVRREEPGPLPATDPLMSWKATASQRAVVKYFWVVAALILVQIAMGIVTAHYGVEGGGLYGVKLADWLPYSLTRTWHIQTGLFWIATAWLAAGLFIGPLVSGIGPKGQRFGVNVLFLALFVVVGGSLTGEWLSIQGKLSDATSFLWGHQGYEYIDLGRGWQFLLFVGLLLWLYLVVRAVRPALKSGSSAQRQLLWVFIMSAAAIGLLYGAGLNWGHHTHLSIVEYWRWWVVHLWVEGFFEVFATVVIAFFFTRLNLIQPALAAKSALLSATIYLGGALQVADPLLRSGGFLEHGGRRAVRIHDQPAHRALLHARAEHDAAAWPRRPVRRLRHAGRRADAGMPARARTGRGVEGGLAQILLLGHEHRPPGHVRGEPAAGGPVADVGLGGPGVLVRPQQRVSRHADDADLALAARSRGYDLRRRGSGSGGIRGDHPAAADCVLTGSVSGGAG